MAVGTVASVIGRLVPVTASGQGQGAGVNIPLRPSGHGGDGGHGGSVRAEAVEGLNTLIDYRYQQHFFAKSGQPGMGNQKTGKSGDDIVLKVPLGTEILDEDEETVLAAAE